MDERWIEGGVWLIENIPENGCSYEDS